jgi:hypothetical protein
MPFFVTPYASMGCLCVRPGETLKPQHDGDIIYRLWGERVPTKSQTRKSLTKREKAKLLRNRLYQLELDAKAELKQVKDLPITIERPRNNYLHLIEAVD